ncbi:MAG: peptidase dimerization domain-containing protein, partial [Burkholderiaceae bacterium]
IDIVVHGIGGSGASPHATKDPVYIGSQIVIALQGIISRELAPTTAGVITVGSFHAGTKANVISDSAKLQITFRANDEDTMRFLVKAIERVAHGVARAGLQAQRATPETLLLIADCVQWARALMQSGAPLVHRLPGRAGWELRLVVQGGLRILDRIEALGYTTLSQRPTLRRRDWLVMAGRALAM